MVVAFLAILLAACGSHPLTVGSKNFTEQVILGEIVAQQLEKRLSVKVSRKLNLGGTLLAHQALVKGEIDLYPEYSGTALTSILKLPADRDSKAVEDTVRREYAARWALEWLKPLGFNNTFAMVVREDETTRTLTEAAARREPWRLGVGYEFVQREDGLPGLVKAYGLRLDGAPKSMDLGLLYQALEQKQVEMVAGSATDGLIAARRLRVLDDDRRYFPPYHASLAVRSATLTKYAGLRDALSALAGKLSDEEMRRLNYEVDGKHRPVAEVAREWLAGK